MKKLYDEIMALDSNDPPSRDYENGFCCARTQAAALAKKYDDEIKKLKFENKYLIEALEQIEAKVSIIDKLIK